MLLIKLHNIIILITALYLSLTVLFKVSWKLCMIYNVNISRCTRQSCASYNIWQLTKLRLCHHNKKMKGCSIAWTKCPQYDYTNKYYPPFLTSPSSSLSLFSLSLPFLSPPPPQDLSADIEAHQSEVEGVLRSLTSLSSHVKLLHPSPVTTYCENLRTAWEGLCQEVGGAYDLSAPCCVCQIKVDSRVDPH